MASSITIGPLRFSTGAVGKNSFGQIFHGQFDDFEDVSIVRIEKIKIELNKQILRTADKHINIARFYWAEQSSDNFQTFL